MKEDFDHVKADDTLRLSQPYGNLTLKNGGAPLLLVSAGVGITPIAAILDHVARTQPGRPVTAVHADRSPDRHPLRADTAIHGSRLRTFTNLTWYEKTTGRVDVDLIPLDEGAEVYLCGPVPFMQHIRAGLHRRGVPDASIRYEVFGSEQWKPVPLPV